MYVLSLSIVTCTVIASSSPYACAAFASFSGCELYLVCLRLECDQPSRAELGKRSYVLYATGILVFKSTKKVLPEDRQVQIGFNVVETVPSRGAGRLLIADAPAISDGRENHLWFEQAGLVHRNAQSGANTSFMQKTR